MALIRPTVTPFPIFAPPAASDSKSTTEVRFSRWNNANAEKFNRQQRNLKDIEDDLRLHRRYQSAFSIANLPTNPPPDNSVFKSVGTPSSPSFPSIPGKRSKYSKPLNPNPNTNTKPLFSVATNHPAFRRVKTKPIPTKELSDGEEGESKDVRVVQGGVSYVVPGAPFEYMYSYTETPKERPLALREPPMTPFGPQTMGRPWTGRKPLPPSKKKLPEFDSFTAPPSKKGMKPVQRPGPFLPGSGPKYVWKREEVLGEELTAEEVKELIEGSRKSSRQLNMGRDGLTHNMLDNIHSHWKRRRVCKIKCKGVCTVDMDNVCHQLEEKTGGKIIYRRGGALFLFRGRNYNYRTRPQFPLMLWKPVSPVYPRLVKRTPDGLTLEEASEMRRKGRDLISICKLAKNGVYVDLVGDIREAFEACELVRIDCQGLNPSDYKKIGGKLKDLVPCVLISFENEHILVWRGREWKSSFDLNSSGNAESHIADAAKGEEVSPEWSNAESPDVNTTTLMVGREPVFQPEDNTECSQFISAEGLKQEDSVEKAESSINMLCAENIGITGKDDNNLLAENGNASINVSDGSSELELPYMEELNLLLRQAVESGNAMVFDEDVVLDADFVYERSVSFAQAAPVGPVFRHRPKKDSVKKSENQETEGGEQVEKAVPVVDRKPKQPSRGKKTNCKSNTGKLKGFPRSYGGVVSKGSLGVDELAKLLA